MEFSQPLFDSSNARPLAWSGIALVLGLAGVLPQAIPGEIAAILLAGIVLGSLLLASRCARPFSGLLFPALAFVLGGAWRNSLESSQPPEALRGLSSTDGNLLRLRGTVLEGAIGQSPEQGESWLVAFEAAVGPQRQVALSGRFRLRMQGAGSGICPGDRIEVLGRWKTPRPASNPHEISRERREFRREIWGSLSTERECLRILARPEFSPRRWLFSLRRHAFERLQDRLAPASLAVAAPLLLGVWPQGGQDAIDLFRRTGAIHLLAVSGMHVSLLFGAATIFLLRRSKPRVCLLIATATLLFAYSGLTGFEIPVLRASLMLVYAIGAMVLRRPSDAVTALGASAWAICLFSPAEIEGPSFQLSFAATAGMILLGPSLAQRLRGFLPPVWEKYRWIQRLCQTLGISLGAFGASFGIVLAHYRLLPQSSIVATLLATPFLAPWMLAGYAAILLPEPCGGGSAWCYAAIESLVLTMLRFCESAFGAPLSFCGTPAWMPALCGIAALLWLGGMARRLAPAIALLATLAWLLTPMFRSFEASKRLRIDILDVGHGNAIVLRTPDGRTTLFDAGSSTRIDLARSVLLPFFHGEGISRIDRLAISHGDADHWNAIPALDGAIPIGEIVCGEGASELLRKALPAGSNATLLDALGPLRWENGGATMFLWRASPERQLDENDASLCLHIGFAGRRVLLCGDLEEEGIRVLLETGEDWQSDILLLPHHGLPNEELGKLLEAVSPRWAIASCGRRFRGEGVAPPGWETLFLATESAGAIRIEIGQDGGFALETQRGAGMMPVRNP